MWQRSFGPQSNMKFVHKINNVKYVKLNVKYVTMDIQHEYYKIQNIEL